MTAWRGSLCLLPVLSLTSHAPSGLCLLQRQCLSGNTGPSNLAGRISLPEAVLEGRGCLLAPPTAATPGLSLGWGLAYLWRTFASPPPSPLALWFCLPLSRSLFFRDRWSVLLLYRP